MEPFPDLGFFPSKRLLLPGPCQVSTQTPEENEKCWINLGSNACFFRVYKLPGMKSGQLFVEWGNVGATLEKHAQNTAKL